MPKYFFLIYIISYYIRMPWHVRFIVFMKINNIFINIFNPHPVFLFKLQTVKNEFSGFYFNAAEKNFPDNWISFLYNNFSFSTWNNSPYLAIICKCVITDKFHFITSNLAVKCLSIGASYTILYPSRFFLFLNVSIITSRT